MIFSSSKCPLPALVNWCRVLHHSVGAGLPIVKIFKTMGKSGPRPLRALAQELAGKLNGGDSLEDSLEPHRDVFPPLFVELVAVGEQTGRLEDTFRELERHYESTLTLQRNFRSQMIYPVFQYVAAICIIALLYFILGFLSQMGKAATVDPLGLGLSGTAGAIMILACGLGLMGSVLLVMKIAANNVQYRARLEGLALSVPGWGPAMLAFALQRFSVALLMCSEAGMRMEKTLHYCFRATCNSSFLAGEQRAIAVAKGGDGLLDAIVASRAPFPDEFKQMLRMAEETGNTTEIMERMANRYREDSERKLKNAAQITSYAIYGMVAIFIIICIFKLASIYIGALGQAGV